METMNRRRIFLSCVASALMAVSASVSAADKIKVGFLSTLSGPNGFLGLELRDGFNLALKTLGGKLGGLPAEVLIADDQFNVDVAKQTAERMVKRDRVDVLTGIIFSNILLAVAPVAFESKTILLSANAGPSLLAGEGCNRYFFNVAWQNDVNMGMPGALAKERAIKNIYAIAPNYPAGRDAVQGFQTAYGAKVAQESYVKLGQLDYAAEIAQIRAAKPDALYFFLPGGMGINFIKQFVASGLSKDIMLLTSGVNVDEDTIRGVGDSVLGLLNTAHWSRDLDNQANRQFVAAFEREYQRRPTIVASQGWDAAMLLDAAVRDAKGRIEDREALIRGLRAKRFQSVRGDFRWGNNNFPVQDFHMRVVGRDSEGRVTHKTVGIVAKNAADPYASKCPLKW